MPCLRKWTTLAGMVIWYVEAMGPTVVIVVEAFVWVWLGQNWGLAVFLGCIRIDNYVHGCHVR
eukprot:2871520-Ditylum_brightwellii.AAC.1